MRIPRFVNDFFERQDFSCPKCHNDFDVKGVIFLGIKPVSHVQGQIKDMLYVEYICPKCKEKVGYEVIDMDLKEFASATIEDPVLQDEEKIVDSSIFNTEHVIGEEKPQKNNVKHLKSRVKSKITIEEKKAAINSLENCNTWKDLLTQIGFPVDGKAEKEQQKEQSFRLTSGEDENE